MHCCKISGDEIIIFLQTSRNIVCELDSTKSGHRTKTLNLTAEGILPGDDCVISGCYETKEMSTHTLHNVRCTVPRKLNIVSPVDQNSL